MGDSSSPSNNSGTIVAPAASAMDSSHPYYLHPSDSPGMNLISTVFDGRGFPGWRRSILIALSAKRKLGFINGTCQALVSDASDSSQWNCCNDMVTSWLLNSLSKENEDSVIYSNSAKELWDSLEQRFGKSNGTKLFHLQKELNGLVQGNSDISCYFTKLKHLWDELDSLNADITCSCVCVCNGKSKISKSLQDQRLSQFIMGLNDTYGQARGTILMINPLSGMDLAYSLLLQDENQRKIYQHTQTAPDSFSFIAVNHGNHNHSSGSPNLRNGNGNQNFRNGYSGQKSGVYPQKPDFLSQRSGINTQRTRGKKSKYNPNVTCTYCFRTGHVMDDCHKLHGYL
ncbi:uncharacterized protein LOC125831955 [Solanum verrucosum]|uniref:uncharacterized protein LOC125831955 n=1 Tax=Solanum verrucosum TaxID=315347 RepID=UPI0020D02770|nr:uncharacterized protein LOC125831955 [Solanum verrucosum]